MPLGKLIVMPAESTPTIATEDNHEVVAYFEFGVHADYYGRLFARSPSPLDALLEIKRLTWRVDNYDADPFAFADLIDGLGLSAVRSAT
jgi:hypothetical protein